MRKHPTTPTHVPCSAVLLPKQTEAHIPRTRCGLVGPGHRSGNVAHVATGQNAPSVSMQLPKHKPWCIELRFDPTTLYLVGQRCCSAGVKFTAHTASTLSDVIYTSAHPNVNWKPRATSTSSTATRLEEIFATGYIYTVLSIELTRLSHIRYISAAGLNCPQVSSAPLGTARGHVALPCHTHSVVRRLSTNDRQVTQKRLLVPGLVIELQSTD